MKIESSKRGVQAIPSSRSHALGDPRAATWVPLICLLFLAVGCSKPEAQASATSPGPVELDSSGQMHEFLASSRFSSVPDRADWWDFDADGSFEAQLGEERVTGKWNATTSRLELTEVRVAKDGNDPIEAPDRSHALRWLDGKLNIEIDERQYRMY